MRHGKPQHSTRSGRLLAAAARPTTCRGPAGRRGPAGAVSSPIGSRPGSGLLAARAETATGSWPSSRRVGDERRGNRRHGGDERDPPADLLHAVRESSPYNPRRGSPAGAVRAPEDHTRQLADGRFRPNSRPPRPRVPRAPGEQRSGPRRRQRRRAGRGHGRRAGRDGRRADDWPTRYAEHEEHLREICATCGARPS